MKAIAVDCPNPRCAGGTLNSKRRKYPTDCGTTRFSRILFQEKTHYVIFLVFLGIDITLIPIGLLTGNLPVLYIGMFLGIANIFMYAFLSLVSRLKAGRYAVISYSCTGCKYSWSLREDTSEQAWLKRLKGWENDLIWFRKTDNKPELRLALINVAAVGLGYSVDYHRAQRLLEESVTLGSDIRVIWMYNVYAILNLGRIAEFQGKYGMAQESFEKCIVASQQRKDYSGYMVALCFVGYAHLYQGAVPQAISAFKESLEAFYLSGQRYNTELSLDGLAGVAARQNQPVRAARLFGAAEARREKSQDIIAPLRRPQYERLVEEARAQLDPAVFAAMWAEGRALILEDAITYALEENVPIALG